MQVHVVLIKQSLSIGEVLKEDLTKYINLDVTKIRIEELLLTHKCLIILDDIWSVSHASIFRDILGPNSKILITTRERGMASNLDGKEYRLATLNKTDALRLLSNWAITDDVGA